MVLTSGFTNTPITRLLILLYTTTSILTTLLSIKHLLPIRPTPHLWPYLQLSRLATFPLASTASTDLLLTTILLYTFRVLERLYGPRKYLSFLLLTLTLSAILTVFLGSTLTALTLTRYNYIPSGLTPLTFACLAAYTHEVPGLYRWRVLLPTGSRSSGGGSARLKGITFSDKSTTYLLATQLALSQFPYNLLPAGVGWVVGTAWVGDMLLPRWRVKGWVVGEGRRDRERERYEGLRRRLEEDNAGRDDGMRQAVVPPPTTAAEDAGRRRGVVGQVGEFVRGVF